MGLGEWKGLAVHGTTSSDIACIIFWLDKLSGTPGNAGEVNRGEYVIKETLQAEITVMTAVPGWCAPVGEQGSNEDGAYKLYNKQSIATSTVVI